MLPKQKLYCLPRVFNIFLYTIDFTVVNKRSTNPMLQFLNEMAD